MVDPYVTRFIKESDKYELINLYHIARTALSGGDDSTYARRLWAARQFAKTHPDVSETAAYKDLDGLLA